MRRLAVEEFSVIRDAKFDFSGINVIIGPQATGKSLLCKLAYFFLDIASAAVDAISDEVSLDDFSQQAKVRFMGWFPCDSWGKKKFKIEYQQGSFGASVVRTSRSGTVGTSIRLWLSPQFREAYESALDQVRVFNQKVTSRRSSEDAIPLWQVRDLARKRIRSMFKEQSEIQTYIPAGRAFFTTYSKAISVFKGNSLDPITERFGATMERILDGRGYLPPREVRSLRVFNETRDRILKGHLKIKRGVPSFESEDGRTLSLSHLSSGTQEVLPLLSSLQQALSGLPGRTIYAEEPEVHLFPNAQVELVKLFSWMARAHRYKSCWVITTHSPYILTAFNDLIKAGQAAKASPSREAEIDKIVGKQFWIPQGEFGAFAFDGNDGILKRIIEDDTGLIDGDVLDDVSSTIGSEFERLLEIQYGE